MGRFLRIYRDFSGGLSEAANDNIADNQLVEARNIMPGDGYGIAKSYGTNIAYPRIPVANPQLNTISKIIELKLASGIVELLAFVSVPVDLEDFYRYSEATASWELIAANIPSVKDWYVHAGILYWLNGVSLKKYDGNSVGDAILTNIGANPTEGEINLWQKVRQGVSVEQRGHRWFYATTNNEIIFSEVGEPRMFPPANIININSKSGDNITAIHEFNDGLLIFQQHSVYYLVGWDFAAGSDIQLIHLNVSSGTVFPRSVVTVDNGVIYLGINGLYFLSIPSYSSAIASENISEGKISGRLFKEGVISEAHAAVWDNTYHISISKLIEQEDGSTESVNYEYRYQPKKKAFFGEFTQGISAYAVGVAKEHALFLGAANGYLLRYDKDSNHYINTASGEPMPIVSLARTKSYDVAGSMVQEVRLERLQLAARQFLGKSSQFRMQIKADYGEQSWNSELLWDADMDESLVYGEGLLGTGIWGWQDTITKEMVVRRRCKRLQFIIKTSAEDQPLLIYGLAILYRKKRVKGSRRNVMAAPVQG